MPVGFYSPERKARLLLENAVDASDYARAAEIVLKELGLGIHAKAWQGLERQGKPRTGVAWPGMAAQGVRGAEPRAAPPLSRC